MASVALAELDLIRKSCPTLVSTGCTPQFCQSGRMVHTDEPRIGRDLDLTTVEDEASFFLRELVKEGIYSPEEGDNRLTQVLTEIRENSYTHRLKDGNMGVKTAGYWSQTTVELAHGLRLAWKHSRKCIMRSQYMDLK